MKYSILSKLHLLLTFSFFVGICYTGSLLWKVRHVLPYSYAYQYEGVIKTERFVEQSQSFMNMLGGRTSTLWEVQPAINRRKTMVFDSINFGRLEDLEGLSVPLFTNKLEENTYAVKLLNNEPYCGNLITNSVVGQTLRRYGVVHLCRAPIITSEGYLVGYVSIGFRDLPDEKRRSSIEKQLQVFAASLLR